MLIDAIRTVVMFLFMSVACFALTPWGLPTKVDVSAYAVNDYSQWSNTPNLSRSIYHKERFINQMQEKLRSKYQSISSVVRHNRENSAATKSNFLNDNTNNSEFVFFAGRGNKNYLAFYNNNGVVYSNSGKTFGGSTRWVIFDAALTLNAPDYNLEQWFNGAHAILGNYSAGWQYIKSYNCFFSCDHYRSEDKYNKFASRFVTNAETIWSAYNNAVKEAIYNNGGKSIEPAIAYRVGNADNGQYVDFSEERLQNVYNGPFSVQNGASNVRTLLKGTAYGTPQY